MNYLKPFLVVLFLIQTFSVLACDICGSYMGITPYDNKNSISFLHRYRVFNGYRNYQKNVNFFPPSAYRTMHGYSPEDSSQAYNQYDSKLDFESYKIFELRMKYFVSKKIELNVFAPLVDNKSKINETYTHHTGFGDVSVNAAYHLISPNSSHKIKHKFLCGIGVKLPTGNFYAHDQKGNRLAFEMQPGSGSWDGFIYTNYIVAANKIGINMMVNYKMNGTNIYHEKTSNSNNSILSVFYKISAKNITILPLIQANYEYTKGLMLKNVLQKNTQVNSLLLGPGIDVFYKSFSLNFNWQFTVAEKIKDESLKSVGRISMGLNYSFGKE